MASKSSISRNRKRVSSSSKRTSTKKIKSKSSSGVKSEYPSDVLLRIRLGNGIKYITRGKETNKEYIFDGSSSVQSVDSRDAPEMLSRTVNKRGCCSGADEQYVFEKLGE